VFRPRLRCTDHLSCGSQTLAKVALFDEAELERGTSQELSEESFCS
jgi:hypothetical protein